MGNDDKLTATLLHITLHYGPDGEPTDSYKISKKLEKDCFKGTKNP
jgi:hypothetical protein